MKNRSEKMSALILCIVMMHADSSFSQGRTDPIKSDDKPTSAASVAVPESWFTAKPVADKVWRIDDHGSDNAYLVEGKGKALLIDTGLGAADLAGFIKSLTALQVIVVNTHGHPDHAGGNFQFGRVYAHPADFELIKRYTGGDYRAGTVQRILRESPGLTAFILKDSSGSFCLLDAGNKLLFTGDNDNTLVWLFLNDCLPLETYLKTLQKVQAKAGEFETLLPGHGDPIDKTFIGEQIACAQNILSGVCKGESYQSFAGEALLCTYKRAGIAYNPNNLYVK